MEAAGTTLWGWWDLQGSQHSAVRDCLLAHCIIGSQIAFDEEGHVQNDAATIPNYVELTSDVVSAYVSKNSVSRTDLPGLIGTVHAALSGTSVPAQSNEKLTPPVQSTRLSARIISSALRM